tara:strand:- start:9 stop:215 length:207 start_codon:yes stop_codon:yes gene_type:complete
MKVSKMIEQLEGQVRRLKAMKIQDTNVFVTVRDVDGYSDDCFEVNDVEVLFDLQEDNNILVEFSYEKK